MNDQQTSPGPLRWVPVPTRDSLGLYAALVLFSIVTWLVGHHLASQAMPNLRLFGWEEVAVVALGGLGIWLAPRVGFADLLDRRVSVSQRVGWPLLIGLAFAVADVAVYRLVIHPESVTSLTPFMQPFPYSILLYTSGALYTDCLYRLIPIPFLMWLVGGFVLSNPRNKPLFWVLALLSSGVEPLDQLLTDSTGLMVYSFTTGYAMNLLQAVFFRRYGFLAGLMIRLGHYLLWHIGFGLWVEMGGA